MGSILPSSERRRQRQAEGIVQKLQVPGSRHLDRAQGREVRGLPLDVEQSAVSITPVVPHPVHQGDERGL
jgi:hypothetical protein